MVNFTIIAGGFTSFMATYLFNSDTNSLSLFKKDTTGPDVGWIASHPTNLSILYATSGDSSGALQSYLVSSTGVVTGPIDSVPSKGSGPAFATPLPIGGQVAILNYDSGNGLIVPTTTDPLHFATNASSIKFPAPAGGASHPHMALQHGNEVFVADLVNTSTLASVANMSLIFVIFRAQTKFGGW